MGHATGTTRALSKRSVHALTSARACRGLVDIRMQPLAAGLHTPTVSSTEHATVRVDSRGHLIATDRRLFRHRPVTVPSSTPNSTDDIHLPTTTGDTSTNIASDARVETPAGENHLEATDKRKRTLGMTVSDTFFVSS